MRMPGDLLVTMARVVRAAARDPVRAPLAVAAREIAGRAGASVVVFQMPGEPGVRYPEHASWPPAELVARWHARVVQRRRAVRVAPRRATGAAAHGVLLPVFLATGGTGALGVFFDTTVPGRVEAEMPALLALASTAAACAAGARLRQQTEIVTRAEVRERLAREIHDGPLQLLSGLLLRLRPRTGRGEVLERAEADLRRAIQQLRALIVHLRLTQSRAPLPERIRETLAQLGSARRVSWALRWSRDVGRLRDDVADELFAVVGEALINAVRHGAATRIEVTGRARGGMLEIVVRDNGVGFNVAKALRGEASPRSFGLLNMQERVAHLGGMLMLQSRPGKGTRVVVRMPRGRRSGKGKAAGKERRGAA
jgi:signal transduction histidine kinase